MSRVTKVCLLILFMSCSYAQAVSRAFSPTKDQAYFVESNLLELSLSEKIGQFFLLGFMGQQMEPPLKRILDKIKPGGLIYFGRNISSLDQVALLQQEVLSYQENKKTVPLWLALDQEGGDVSRIKSWPPFPSALAVGKTQDPELAYELGNISGDILKNLGFNLNLAPVLDVLHPENPSFIGTRSFGASPELVSKMSFHYALGLLHGGVLPTSKHFPGHGGLKTDSHLSLPVSQATLEELTQNDISPFQHLIQKRLPFSVLVAHVAFPKIDPSGNPATFSSLILNDVLRKRLGFQGLIITDDLEMAAASHFGVPSERAIRALQSGADIILLAWNSRDQYEAYEGLLKAVTLGRISSNFIDSKVRGILEAKMQFQILQKKSAAIQVEKAKEALASQRLRKMINRIFAINFSNAIQSNVQSLRKFSNPPLTVFGLSNNFFTSFSKYYLGSTPLQIDLRNIDSALKTQGARLQERLLLFYVSGRSSSALLQKLPIRLRQQTLVINTQDPNLIMNRKDYLAVWDVNTSHPETGRLSALVLNQSLLSNADKEVRRSVSGTTAN